MLSTVNVSTDQVERRNGIRFCVPVFCVLVVLREGVVKGITLPVAVCVAVHLSVLGVCRYVFVCIPGIRTILATS